MDAPAWLTLLATVATAVATIVLASLTGKYVRLTNALVEEAKSSRLPNVYVDLELDSFDVKLVIGNSGNAPAVDITFDVTDSVPWRHLGDRPTGLAALPVISKGITYLAPGRVLKFHAGIVSHDDKFFADGSEVQFILRFKSEEGKSLERAFTIELHSYTGILLESFQDPEREVARAIRDSESSKSSKETMKSMVDRMGKRNCPACRELISRKAMKCPRCRHIIRRFRVDA